jgi:hypothetical protein
MRRPDDPRRNRPDTLRSWGLVNIKVVGGAIVIASLLLIVTFSLLLATRPPRRNPGPATAVLTLIAANTATPALATPGLGVGTGETPVPTPLPGQIAIDAHVQIVGTGGDGLRLRDQPGLAGAVLMLGSESEVFRVADGPQELDGYTWWKLVGPFDPSRGGWAVVNYLEVVEGPQ